MSLMSDRRVRGPFAGPPQPDHFMPDDHGFSPEVTTMLENGPLYRKYAYRCRGPVRLPGEVSLFCESQKCGGFRIFKLDPESSLEHCQYRCSNCGLTRYRFLLTWDRRHEQEEYSYVSPDGQTAELMNYEIGKVAKVGQDPEPRDYISTELAKRLGEMHARYYRTAIRLRNFN